MTEIKVTDGSMSFEAVGEVTLEEIRRIIAVGEALGVPSDAVITSFTMNFYGADRNRFDLRWDARRRAGGATTPG